MGQSGDELTAGWQPALATPAPRTCGHAFRRAALRSVVSMVRRPLHRSSSRRYTASLVANSSLLYVLDRGCRLNYATVHTGLRRFHVGIMRRACHFSTVGLCGCRSRLDKNGACLAKHAHVSFWLVDT